MVGKRGSALLNGAWGSRSQGGGCGFIDVESTQQVMAGTADEPGLQHDPGAQLVLHVRRIILNRSVLESLIDREHSVRGRRQCRISENWLTVNNCVVAARSRKDRTRSNGVVDDAGSASIRRPVVTEAVEIR